MNKLTITLRVQIEQEFLPREKKILFSSSVKDYPSYKYVQGRVHGLLDLLQVISSKCEAKLECNVDLLLERKAKLHEDHLLYEGLVTNYLNTEVIDMPTGYTVMDALVDGYDDYLSRIDDEDSTCTIVDYASYRYYLGKLHAAEQCQRHVIELKKRLG